MPILDLALLRILLEWVRMALACPSPEIRQHDRYRTRSGLDSLVAALHFKLYIYVTIRLALDMPSPKLRPGASLKGFTHYLSNLGNRADFVSLFLVPPLACLPPRPPLPFPLDPNLLASIIIEGFGLRSDLRNTLLALLLRIKSGGWTR